MILLRLPQLLTEAVGLGKSVGMAHVPDLIVACRANLRWDSAIECELPHRPLAESAARPGSCLRWVPPTSRDDESSRLQTPPPRAGLAEDIAIVELPFGEFE